jgi:glycosyltransferase involved in cell wall biosynthesis
MVSPYPPLRCPVALHTQQLRQALALAAPEITVDVCAIDHGRRAGTPSEVSGTIEVDDPSAYRRCAQRLYAHGADLVSINAVLAASGHGRTRHLLGLVSELDRLLVPYVVLLHDVRRSPAPEDADVATALCRNAVAVCVASQAAADSLVHSRLAVADRVAVIGAAAVEPAIASAPTGPSGARHVRARPGPGPSELTLAPIEGPLLSTVGLAGPAKGIHVALQALAAISADQPAARYVVAGNVGHSPAAWHSCEPYRHRLRRLTAELGIADRVQVVETPLDGWDLARLWAATTLYVAPDLDCGRTFSASLSQALVAGRPVVASRTPYAAEVVTDAVGELVPPADPNGLAAAMTNLLAVPPPRTAREVAIADLTMAAAAHRYAVVVRTAVRGTGLCSGSSPADPPAFARRDRGLAGHRGQ